MEKRYESIGNFSIHHDSVPVIVDKDEIIAAV